MKKEDNDASKEEVSLVKNNSSSALALEQDANPSED